MLQYLSHGILLGLAYVAPIKMQNLFVINTAVQGNIARTALVVLSTVFRRNISRKIIKGVNLICGGIIFLYGLNLGYEFINLIKIYI